MSNPFSAFGMPDAYWGMIQNSVAQYGGDAMTIGTVMVLEAGGTNYTTGALQSGSFNPNATSPAGAQGLMQFMPATGRQYGLDGSTDPTDPHSPFNPQASINAANQMIREKGVGAYNPGDPNYATRDFYNVYTAAGGNNPAILSQIQVAQAASAQGTGGTPPTIGTTSPVLNITSVTAVPLPNQGNTPSTSGAAITALTPGLIIQTGSNSTALNNTPWYKDPNLLTGNQQVTKASTPVVFKVMLTRSTPTTWLPTGAAGTTPLEVRLNASMKSFNVTSKHNFHQQQTRTAWHLTMWGLQADTIEGTCSTGVFMNAMGLTDFFSTSTVSDTLQSLLTSGVSVTPTGINGQVTAGGVLNSPNTYSTILQKEKVSNPSEAMRVAAQDAFVEFLSLFRMNGNVWYSKDGYQKTGQELSPAGISMFSPVTGSSNMQMNARNNDMLTRGYVTLRYKAQEFRGFFRSLSWQLDAAHPFSWNFTFVFQVEQTINKIYIPG